MSLKYFLQDPGGLEGHYLLWVLEELRKFIPQVHLETKVDVRIGQHMRPYIVTEIFESQNLSLQSKTITEKRQILVPHSSGWRNFWLRLKFLFVPRVDVLRELFHYESYTVEVPNTQLPMPKSIRQELDFNSYGFISDRFEIRIRCAYDKFNDVLTIVHYQKEDRYL